MLVTHITLGFKLFISLKKKDILTNWFIQAGIRYPVFMALRLTPELELD